MTKAPKAYSTLDEAAAWLTDETGREWTPHDLLEPLAAMLHVWLQVEHDDPRAPLLPFQMTDGVPVPLVFAGDANRLAFTGRGRTDNDPRCRPTHQIHARGAVFCR